MRDPNRVWWNEQFKILQDTWPKPDNFEKCIDTFLDLHAMVHSSKVSQTGLYSFEDEVWNRVADETFRKVYRDDQSIAWKLWHSGRIEDITMNLLVAGDDQIFTSDGWLEKLRISARDTGNAMNEEEIKLLSDSIDMDALKQYRAEVAMRTRSVVKALTPQDLKQKIEPTRLKSVSDEGAVVEEARWLIDYWGGKTYSGLLLMPASRHLLVHLNESLRLLDRKTNG